MAKSKRRVPVLDHDTGRVENSSLYEINGKSSEELVLSTEENEKDEDLSTNEENT
jgi:hypothetical protein